MPGTSDNVDIPKRTHQKKWTALVTGSALVLESKQRVYEMRGSEELKDD